MDAGIGLHSVTRDRASAIAQPVAGELADLRADVGTARWARPYVWWWSHATC